MFLLFVFHVGVRTSALSAGLDAFAHVCLSFPAELHGVTQPGVWVRRHRRPDRRAFRYGWRPQTCKQLLLNPFIQLESSRFRNTVFAISPLCQYNNSFYVACVDSSSSLHQLLHLQAVNSLAAAATLWPGLFRLWLWKGVFVTARAPAAPSSAARWIMEESENGKKDENKGRRERWSQGERRSSGWSLGISTLSESLAHRGMKRMLPQASSLHI